MNSSSSAHALYNDLDAPDEGTLTRPGLTVVPDPPRPLEDPLFRYVLLGFVSFFMILGVAAMLSF